MFNNGQNVRPELTEYIREILKKNLIQNIYFGFSRPIPDFPVSLHFISRLTIPLSGTIQIIAAYDGKIGKKELMPGDILFTGKNGWAFTEQRNNSHCLSIVFIPKSLRVVYTQCANNVITYNPWYNTNNDISDICHHLLHLLNIIMKENNAEREARALPLIRVLLMQSIIDICRDKPSVIGKADATFQIIYNYLCENFHEPISRNSTARFLNLSPTYISTLFSKTGRNSFHNILNTMRMEKGKYLLEKRTLSIKKIAMQCGFTSDAYFIKAFRKYTGKTPGDYKSQNLRIDNVLS